MPIKHLEFTRLLCNDKVRFMQDMINKDLEQLRTYKNVWLKDMNGYENIYIALGNLFKMRFYFVIIHFRNQIDENFNIIDRLLYRGIICVL